MRSRASLWLRALCDPAGLDEQSVVHLPAASIEEPGVERLQDLARDHGVLPAVCANLNRLLHAGPQGQGAGCNVENLQNVLLKARQELLRQAGTTLVLRSAAVAAAAAMAKAQVPAIILKGTDFADRLYPAPLLRTQRDVDVLVPAGAVPAAQDVLRDLGYQPAPPPRLKHPGDYGQESWWPPDLAGGPVELHWNLVNSPTVRRGVNVGYEDLSFEAATDLCDTVSPRGDASRTTAPRAGRQQAVATVVAVQSRPAARPPVAALSVPTPASCLLIAAVHGGTSHSFERLQLLCDIRQLARRAAGAIDVGWLAQTARRTGAAGTLATALRLTARALNCVHSAELLIELGLQEPPLWRWVLTPAVVTGEAPLTRCRQQLFRQLLKKSQRASMANDLRSQAYN